MKKISILFGLLWLSLFTASFAVVVAPADDITIVARTIYTDGNLAAPDSVRVIVTLDGTELTDAWYNSADAQCTSANGALVFFDQLQDIDGAGGDGQYLIEIGAYSFDSTLYTWYYYSYEVGIYHSIDWADVANPTATVGLTNTTVGTVTTTTTATNLTTNNDKTGYTASTVSDKTGYSLSQTFPTNFADLAITASTGKVTVGTNDDKTGYSLAGGVTLAAGEYTKMNDSLWGIGGRTLSSLGFTLAAGDFGAGSLNGKGDWSTHAALDVWDVSFGTAFTAGSMGDSLNNSTYVQGAASSLDTSDIRAAVWGTDTSDVTGGMGQMLKDTSAYQGSASGLTYQGIWSYANRTLTALSAESTTVSLVDGDIANDALGLAPPTGWSTLTIANNAVNADLRYWQGNAVDTLASGEPSLVGCAIRSGGIQEESFADGSIYLSKIDASVYAKIAQDAADSAWAEVARTITGGVLTTPADYKATGFSVPGDPMTLTAAERGAVEDSVHANAVDYMVDLTEAQDSINVVLTQIAINLDSLFAALDTLQNQDDWNATLANQTTTLDSLFAVLDSLQNQDDWVSKEASLFDPTTDSTLIDISSNLIYADTIANRVIEDSSSYQGAAGSVTNASIDSTLEANHGSGSWQTGGTGSGLYAVWFYAIDSSTSDTLSNVTVVVQNAAGTKLASGATNDSGYIELQVDGSIRIIAALSPAYSFDAATATVTANDTINILGYPNVIAAPSAPDYCRAYAYLKEITDDWADDIIVTVERVTGAATNTTSGFTIMPLHRVDTTDAAGYFNFDLLQTVFFDDTTKGLYNFKGMYKNTVVFRIDSLVMPAQSTLDLTDSIAVRGTL